MDHRESGIRVWSSLEEELDALESNPVAQALLDDLELQNPERVERVITITELREQVTLEEPEP